jgi:hypothetical protein
LPPEAPAFIAANSFCTCSITMLDRDGDHRVRSVPLGHIFWGQ